MIIWLIPLVALLAPAIPVLLTYFLNNRKNDKRAALLAENQTTQTAKLDEIHVLVNDRLTKALDAVVVLNKKITDLESLLEKERQKTNGS